MLWNPKWGKKIKTTPSRAGFVAWLERQNPAAKYQYWSTDCAIGLYLRSIGTSMLDEVSTHFDLIYRMNVTITKATPHTFGAALERARIGH